MKQINRFRFFIVIIAFSFLTSEAFQIKPSGKKMEKVTHKENVHQYIVREAYDLLKLQFGSIPEFESHLGYNEIGSRAWETKKVVTGAWREDLEDVVYNISLHEELSEIYPPPINWILDEIVQIFGGDPNPLVSISHFWNSDAGTESGVSIAIDATVGTVTFGPFPNAFKKIKAYEGGRQWIMRWRPGWANGQAEFKKPDGSNIYFTYHGEIGFEYQSLADLYKTGRAWIVGTYNEASIWVPYNIEIRLSSGWREIFVWEILGRMAHLVGDMSIPAHTHNDEHGTKDDRYEEFMATGYSAWDAQRVLTESGGAINPFANSDPLYFSMYTMNQICDHFASEDVDGDDNYTNIGNLNTIIPSLGQPQTKEQITSTNLENIRDKTFPYVIRETAGLFYWFAVETGLIPITVPFETLPEALSHATPSQTVRVLAGTHNLQTSVTVPNGVRLEIMPGVTIKFQNNSRLTVNGNLYAVGTPNARIIFDGLHQTQSDETNGLIRVNGMSSNNFVSISYADIKNANCLVYANHPNGLTIQNCNFSNFSFTPIGYAFSIFDCISSADFINNTITGLWDYGYEDILPVGVKVSAWDPIVLRRVTIQGNTITKCYKAIDIQKTNVNIQNNTIRDNFKAIELYLSQAEINSNMLRDNVYGTYFLTSQAGLVYNTIYNSSEIGVWSQNSYTNFTRNRISNNGIGVYFYSAVSNFRENYIGDNYSAQVFSEHLSNSIFGTPEGTAGCNRLIGTTISPDVLTVSGGSYVELGIYNPGDEYNLSGYNSIIRNNPSGKHITVTSGTANAGYCYFNLPLAVVGNVYVYNRLEYDPTSLLSTWPGDPEGSMSPTFPNALHSLKSDGTIKNITSKRVTSLLTTMDARFDSAMRKRSKEEVLLTLGLSYKAQKMYEPAIAIFEKIVKGEKRTKFDIEALVLLYSTYREQLFDSSNPSFVRRWQNRNSLKQKLISIPTFNSDLKVSSMANVMLAKEMVRFGEFDDAVVAYKFLERETRSKEEQKYVLFDLFSLYIREKKDTASAKSVLSKLETQFPDDDLVAIAKSQIGIYVHGSSRQASSKSDKLAKTPTKIEKSIPESYALNQNYPNPFNPTTTIQYQLPEDSYVTLSIYDIHGKEVIRLSEGLNVAGYYEAHWNGKSANQFSVASGIYFYRIVAQPLKNSQTSYNATKKMLLLK